ncbi:siroheme synthase CysG [Niveispirillum sp. BGYR6]|uniref:siroheme synthase CysG n=1 Tax=Niveispirillum sp. BGYR6 TaxID=2971249 RepID=UPI0022B9BE01|nr:siroheme synthase CysG [Niveispirillum sp. BGYR6]MDG5496073.1 siroheme synthase CysG [Niveispirillum sp. BGYR6]
MSHLSPLPDRAEPMPYFPIFLDLRGRVVLLVGGGEAAASKARLLARAGADILLVAENLSPEMAELVDQGAISRIERQFRPGLLDGATLAFDGAGDAELTDRLRAAAFSRNVLVNVIDVPDQCDFTVPAILDRSPLIIAISTGGGAPALARNIRQRLELAIPASYAGIARAAARCRQQVRAALAGFRDRQRFWDALFTDDQLMGLPEAAAIEAIETALAKPRKQPPTGSVTLVGAGPGDPGLLTVKAVQAIAAADVILHDALVPDSILALARRETRLISVGKRAGCRSVPQEFTNRLMVSEARRGQRVVRLKGGDPFIFGRAGEEAAFLREQGVGVEIVPGITAAMGAAAQLGIPLTHRGVARSLRIVTAHCRTEAETDLIDWASLADPSTTLALYMGRDRLSTIAENLIGAGLPAQTPAALVANATRPDMQVQFAPLTALAGGSVLIDGTAPSLILIGNAVAQAPGWAAVTPQLCRHDDPPLYGMSNT